GGLLGIITEHKAIADELLLYCRDRPSDARVAGREESKVWNRQHAGIESFATIGLRERSHSWVEAALAHLHVDPVPKRTNVRKDLLAFIATKSKFLDGLCSSIKKHPGHDFRLGEVPPPASHFPNAVVRALPGIVHEGNQVLKQMPTFVPLVQ